MKKITLTLLIFGAVCTLSFAQSSYLEKGQNGYEISGGITTNENGSGFYGQAGYSFSGVFDLGLTLSRFGFDQQFLGEDLYAAVIAPFVSYFPVKQDDSIPVSIQVGGIYRKVLYSSDALDDNNIDMWGDEFIIGAALITDIKASDAIKIQPNAEIIYVTGETKIEDSFGSRFSSYNSTVLNLRVSLILKTSPGNSFVVTPSIGIREEGTTYRLALKFVLPQN